MDNIYIYDICTYNNLLAECESFGIYIINDLNTLKLNLTNSKMNSNVLMLIKNKILKNSYLAKKFPNNIKYNHTYFDGNNLQLILSEGDYSHFQQKYDNYKFSNTEKKPFIVKFVQIYIQEKYVDGEIYIRLGISFLDHSQNFNIVENDTVQIPKSINRPKQKYNDDIVVIQSYRQKKDTIVNNIVDIIKKKKKL